MLVCLPLQLSLILNLCLKHRSFLPPSPLRTNPGSTFDFNLSSRPWSLSPSAGRERERERNRGKRDKVTNQLPAAPLFMLFVGFRPFSLSLCYLHADTQTRSHMLWYAQTTHVYTYWWFDLVPWWTPLCGGRKQLIQSELTQSGICCSYNHTGRSSAVGIGECKNLSFTSPVAWFVVSLVCVEGGGGDRPGPKGSWYFQEVLKRPHPLLPSIFYSESETSAIKRMIYFRIIYSHQHLFCKKI